MSAVVPPCQMSLNRGEGSSIVGLTAKSECFRIKYMSYTVSQKKKQVKLFLS